MLLGSFMLYDAPETGLRISWLVVIPTVGAMAGIVVFAVSAGVRALYRAPSTGVAGMVGRVGVVRSALDPEGQVMIDGELWRAVAQEGSVAAGEAVEVTAMNGLTLNVTRSTRRA
jgi:membrane-bound serine protease (ClpP class)